MPFLRRLTLLLLGLLVASPAAVAAPPSPEYRIKAVFLYNFVQFVEWPPDAFATPSSPVVIGLLGDDPFGIFLDELVRGEVVGARSIVVKRYRRAEEIADCHILFFGSSKLDPPEHSLAIVKNRSILTVSDREGFAQAGGLVGFFTEDGKIRLRINNERARACGLIISSKILRAARLVGPERP